MGDGERGSVLRNAAVLSPALLLLLLFLAGCGGGEAPDSGTDGPFLMVLGVAQDGGYPQASCSRACCARAVEDPGERRHVASLGLIDPSASARFLIDVTPDLRDQLALLNDAVPIAGGHGIDGILLTHAHVGHYLGLAQLGREVMGAWEVPVHAMPRMGEFLRSSGPWDQLVRLHNIQLLPLKAGTAVSLTPSIRVTPLRVPHRDEYSETVAFRIEGPERSALYIPDIDKWERWEVPLEEALAGVDRAYLDGTFYAAGEVPERDASEIPHPLIEETMSRLAPLPPEERAKVRFIHLNHTNPALQPDGEIRRTILAAGFGLAEQGERFDL